MRHRTIADPKKFTPLSLHTRLFAFEIIFPSLGAASLEFEMNEKKPPLCADPFRRQFERLHLSAEE
jgi:hypothetical protein